MICSVHLLLMSHNNQLCLKMCPIHLSLQCCIVFPEQLPHLLLFSIWHFLNITLSIKA